MRLKKRIVQVLALIFMTPVLFVGASSSSQATTLPPGGSGEYRCTSKPVSLTKSNGNITGTMKMSCITTYWRLTVLPVVTDDNGHYKYGPTKTCYNTKTCTASATIKDLTGTQKWWLANDPGGTSVTPTLSNSALVFNCHDGITGSDWLWCYKDYASF